MQNTNHLLMIRPVSFGYNAQTAVNNSFQIESDDENVSEDAVKEFDELVDVLRKNGVEVTVVDDTSEPHTPDSIFPNNWISFHEDGTVCIYPMFAENRRNERKKQVLDEVEEKFIIKNTINFSHYESKNIFLEGTGSMVLDRDNKIAYACLSKRTEKKLLEKFCQAFGYSHVAFIALDEQQKPIYHTNVMMCVADKYVVICLDSIKDPVEKEKVITTIKNSGKEIIEISYDQMNHFAGNMLQVKNNNDKKLLVMSAQAFRNLDTEQIQKLQSFNRIIHSDISTIETNGGGSARCMMAEIFLQPKEVTLKQVAWK